MTRKLYILLAICAPAVLGQSYDLMNWPQRIAGAIPFGGTAGRVGESVSLQWDNTAKTLQIDKGHLRLGQVAAPGAPTVTVNPAVGNLNGNYYYRVSFVTALGETEGGTASVLIAPANQQMDLSAIPISIDSAVTARRIYRTLAGGINFLMQLVTTIGDNTTTTYTDNIADGMLGASAPTVNSTGGLIYNGSNRSGIIDNITTAIGVGAATVNVGYYNSFFGVSSGHSNTTGGDNNFFGASAGYYNTTGYNNNFFGVSAGLANTTGINNNFFGQSAGYSNTTGDSNNFFGQGAGNANTTGDSNGFFGRTAGNANTTGASNNFFGRNAGYYNTTGASNGFFGQGAGYYNTTGNYNSFLGESAGFNPLNEIAQYRITTDTYMTLVGRGATKDNVAQLTNSTAIGAGAHVLASNQVAIGDANVTSTILRGNVGIGTTNPANTLTVNGVISGTSILGNNYFSVTGSTGSVRYTAGQVNSGGEMTVYGGTHATTPGIIQFRTGTGAGQQPEQVRITSTGNVGIGTTVPTYSLDVSGGVASSGTARFFDQTATTGATLVTITPGASQTSASTVLSAGGVVQATALDAASFKAGGTPGITETCTVIPTGITIKAGIITAIAGGTCLP